MTLSSPKPWADIDGDGDVDQTDFGMWQVCFSDDGNAYEAGCDCFDRVDAVEDRCEQGGDGDVDGTDFSCFENCFSGPTVSLNLDPPPVGCVP